MTSRKELEIVAQILTQKCVKMENYEKAIKIVSRNVIDALNGEYNVLRVNMV